MAKPNRNVPFSQGRSVPLYPLAEKLSGANQSALLESLLLPFSDSPGEQRGQLVLVSRPHALAHTAILDQIAHGV